MSESRPSDPPRITVVIPCYNLGAYVDDAVTSVLAQTCQDFEIVIVNDGSTDPETNRVLAGYDRPKTRVLTTANRGLASARNAGIAEARGAFICALDADDKLESTHLEKTIRALDARPSLAFASCWLRTFGDEDWLWQQDRCDLVTLLGECTVCTASLVRRSSLLAVGGFDEKMPHPGYEDWDLWISLVERGYDGLIIPEVLFYYRRRTGSMSDACCYGDAHISLMRYMYEKHRRSYDSRIVDVLDGRHAEVCRLVELDRALAARIEALDAINSRRREELARLHDRIRRVTTGGTSAATGGEA